MGSPAILSFNICSSLILTLSPCLAHLNCHSSCLLVLFCFFFYPHSFFFLKDKVHNFQDWKIMASFKKLDIYFWTVVFILIAFSWVKICLWRGSITASPMWPHWSREDFRGNRSHSRSSSLMFRCLFWGSVYLYLQWSWYYIFEDGNLSHWELRFWNDYLWRNCLISIFLKKFLFFWYVLQITLWYSLDMYFPVLKEDLYQMKEKHMTPLMMATEKTDNIVILYVSQLS